MSNKNLKTTAMAHTVKVDITWTEKNYCCGWGFEGVGAILCTNKTIDGIKHDFEESLRFHIEGLIEDGDEVPQWLIDGDYTIEYTLSAAAMLREAERFTTMAAISRATGINPKLLSHYANGIKRPRPLQLQRIKDALCVIGAQLLNLG